MIMERTLRMKALQEKVISENSGRSLKAVEEATTLEMFLTADEVIEFGTADRIL